MKKNWKLIASIIVLSLISAFCIGYGVSSPLFPEMTNSNDWIGFWGSYAGAIIGGIITMIGVSMTIHSTNRNEIKPYLILSETKLEDISKKVEISGVPDVLNGEQRIQIAIKIKNVGKGVAKNVKLHKENEKKSYILFPVLEYEPNYNEKYFFLISGVTIPKSIKPGDKEKIEDFFRQQRTSYFILDYEDLLGTLYSYKIAIEYECSLKNGMKCNCNIKATLKDWHMEKC